jgi:hypothetical protein
MQPRQSPGHRMARQRRGTGRTSVAQSSARYRSRSPMRGRRNGVPPPEPAWLGRGRSGAWPAGGQPSRRNIAVASMVARRRRCPCQPRRRPAVASPGRCQPRRSPAAASPADPPLPARPQSRRCQPRRRPRSCQRPPARLAGTSVPIAGSASLSGVNPGIPPVNRGRSRDSPRHGASERTHRRYLV